MVADSADDELLVPEENLALFTEELELEWDEDIVDSQDGSDNDVFAEST